MVIVVQSAILPAIAVAVAEVVAGGTNRARKAVKTAAASRTKCEDQRPVNLATRHLVSSNKQGSIPTRDPIGLIGFG